MSQPGYFDGSYPPSVYAPQATGATAGIPGSWTPAGCRVPADHAQVIAWGVVASPATPWTTGQYVQTRTAGAAGRVTWSGTDWVGGAAPLDVAAMTVAAVQEYVRANPDQLAEVYAAEQTGKARASLLTWLKTLLDEEAAQAAAATAP